MMSSEVEALGALVTAGLAADSLDAAGKGAGHPGANGKCANCGAILTGDFCHACGQRTHLHRSLSDVGHEFVHGITHFDGKAWKTLPMLVFRPGKLTRDYIMGKRASYVAPVPLFLLVVFLMFFVFSFVHIKPGGGATNAAGEQMTPAEAAKELPAAEAELRDLDNQIAAARAKGDTVGLAALEGTRTGVAAGRDAVKARAKGETVGETDLAGAIAEVAKGEDFVVMKGAESLNAKVRAALKNPELVLYKIQGKAYKLSFLLVPLSLPWLWLMFAWKPGVRMYDHAIFALYSISFMSLLFVAGSIAITLDFKNGLFWTLLIWIAPMTHMFIQLKGAYAIGNVAAGWRTVALGFASIVTLGIYLVLISILGLID